MYLALRTKQLDTIIKWNIQNMYSPNGKFPWQPKQWASDIHWKIALFHILYCVCWIKQQKWVTEWNMYTKRKCHISNRSLFAIVWSQYASCWNSSYCFTTALSPVIFLFYNNINMLHWYDNDSWTPFVFLSIIYLFKVSTCRES